MSAASPSVPTPAVWLKQVRAQAGRDGRCPAMMAGLLTVADVIPAVGFAAGLALAIGRFDQGLTAIAPWLVLAAVSMAVRGLLAQAATAAGARAAFQIKSDVRQRLLKAAFSNNSTSRGAAMTAVVEGVEALDGYFSRFAPARTAAALSPLLIIGCCAVASPFSAAIMLGTLLPFVAGMILAGTAAAAESRRQFAALEHLSGLFLDRVRALPAILSFQAEARATAELARASTDLEQRTGKVLKIAFLSSAILEFFSALAVALVAVYCGFNLLRVLPFPTPEQLTLSQAFFALALAPEVYAPLRRLAAAYHDRQAAEAAVDALSAAGADADSGAGHSADETRQAASETAPATLALKAAPAIRFDKITVAYDGDSPVLQDFDLDVPAGSIVALTGPSGSGKSTVLHLLLGLAPLSKGRIEINGAVIAPETSLIPAVAWASQSPAVAPGSLRDNIALARQTALDHEVIAAATRAGLSCDPSRVIDERGGGLSGGERRRLGLARAFLKPAPILLLDEPTANLDAASEAALLPIIRAAAEGRTTLIATHSPAVIALADIVVTL